jgi:hypothetical protein
MKKRTLIAGIALVLAFGFAPAQAGIDLNEIAAFLVFPGVAATLDGGLNVETFLTFTNTSTDSIIAHVAFINGNEIDPEYCYECNFDVPMTGQDTETLVLWRSGAGLNAVTHILNLDTGGQRTCNQFIGFVTVEVENAFHETQTSNFLLGEEVVIDYASGAALSVPAISIQGILTDDNDRAFEFDDKEYGRFPSRIGGDFLAPDFDGDLHAYLVLFTLAFQRQLPPFTDCELIGFDAFEEQTSNSFTFGCWTLRSLVDLDPELAYPYLGVSFDEQQHGWFNLVCSVSGTGDGNGIVAGGVHGLIAQLAEDGAYLRRDPQGPAVVGTASWARILYQSGTVGDPMTLYLANPVTGGF